jgi:transposase-like protein
MAEVTAWQARPLKPMYPVMFFDALRVKMREDAVVRNKAIYLALRVLPDDTRDTLALWIESTEAAAAKLDAFEQGAWGRKFPTAVVAWRRAWDRVIPFFAFAPQVRRVIYTTNAIESIHCQLRKIIKTRGHFPSDDAATKLIWLALRNITADWGRAAKEWREAMNQFAIAYGDRFTKTPA